MKKLLAFLMTLAMLASLAVLPASAEEESVYTSLYSSEVSTLNYLTSSTTWDYTPGANVVDTLIEYNNIGEIIPGLAETWEVSEDQLHLDLPPAPGTEVVRLHRRRGGRSYRQRLCGRRQVCADPRI